MSVNTRIVRIASAAVMLAGLGLAAGAPGQPVGRSVPDAGTTRASQPAPAAAKELRFQPLPALPCTAEEIRRMLVTPPDDIYLSVVKKGVYRSTDQGATWNALNDGLDISGSRYTLAQNAQGGVILGMAYGGKEGGGGYYLTDGKLWKKSANLSANRSVTDFALNSAGEIIAVTCWNGDVWNSADHGATYTKVAALSEAAALWVIKRKPDSNELYTGGEAGGGVGILRSTDDGKTWKPFGLNNPEFGGNLYALGFNRRGEILAGRKRASDGSILQRYTDGKWVSVTRGLPLYQYTWDLATTRAGLIFLGADKNLYVSADDGESWSPCAGGLPAGKAMHLALDAKERLYVMLPKSGVYRSVDAAPAPATKPGNP